MNISEFANGYRKENKVLRVKYGSCTTGIMPTGITTEETIILFRNMIGHHVFDFEFGLNQLHGQLRSEYFEVCNRYCDDFLTKNFQYFKDKHLILDGDHFKITNGSELYTEFINSTKPMFTPQLLAEYQKSPFNQ